jgi:hypothetical protein
VGVVAAVWVSGVGPGTASTPDSATYLQGAQNLADGLGLVTFEGTWPQALPRPVSHFPPGPSLLLWLGSLLGLTPLETAPCVAGAFATLYLVGSFLLVRSVVPSRPLLSATWATGVLLAHPSVRYEAGRILSDQPAAAMIVWGAWLAWTGLQPGHARRLRWAALLLSGAVLTRYASVFSVAGIGIGVLAVTSGSWRSRLETVAAVVLPPAGTLLLLVAWNLSGTGEVAGDLGRNSFGLREVDRAFYGLTRIVRDVGFWRKDGAPFEAVIATAAVAWIGVVAVGASWKRPAFRFLGTALAVAFVGMLSALVLRPFSPVIAGRFWLPFWPWVLALLALGLPSPRPWLRVHRWALVGAGFFVLVSLATLPVSLERTVRLRGGFQQPRVAESPAMQMALDAPSVCRTSWANETRAAAANGLRHSMYRLPFEATILPGDARPACVLRLPKGRRGMDRAGWDDLLDQERAAGRIDVLVDDGRTQLLLWK